MSTIGIASGAVTEVLSSNGEAGSNGGSFRGSHAGGEDAPAPSRLAPLEHSELGADQRRELERANDLATSARFVSRLCRFGRPIEAGVGLHKLLGLSSEDEVARLRASGEGAIVEEFATADSTVRDAAGWTDREWLNYIKDAPAEERKMPAGMPCGTLDEGHTNMRLEHFAELPNAVAAGLKRAHVLALRLYTTSVHHSINKPLREGCSPSHPHPYPATVVLLCDALKRMRTTAEDQARDEAKRAATAQAGAADVGSPTKMDEAVTISTLWYGMADVVPHQLHELKQRGATELGFLSATSSRALAEGDILGPADEGSPLLLKVRADLLNGTDLSFLAVFPAEAMCVYPPCTFFEARTGYEEPTTLPSGDEIVIKVVEVVPRIGQQVIGI